MIRVINATEAAVVRRMFELYTKGYGQSRIAKMLNEGRAVAPRSQQGRPRAWAPSSVHEVLGRPLYRGRIVWNRTRKRDQWGQHRQHAKPEVDAPALRIVPQVSLDGGPGPPRGATCAVPESNPRQNIRATPS